MMTIHENIAAWIPALNEAGINVYAYNHSESVCTLSWVIIERNGNTGTLSWEGSKYFGELTVSASIKPSREYGSAVMVDIFDGDIVSAALRTTEPAVQIRFCKTSPIVPNDGMKHFSWAKPFKVGR